MARAMRDTAPRRVVAGFFVLGALFVGCGSSKEDPGAGSQAECTGNGDCPGNRPYCSGGICVECTGNGNCNGNQVCDGHTGQCKTPCSANGDCGGMTPYCADRGVCVRCISDTNCQGPGDGNLCNTAIDRCVECISNNQCSGNHPVCVVRQGQCRECATSADCPSGQACNDYQCVPGACSSDAQCGGERPYCDTGQGACVQCLTDTNCGQGRTCSQQTHQCFGG